jgi:hypothetical protein
MAAWWANVLAQKTHSTFTDYLQTTKCIDNMKPVLSSKHFFYLKEKDTGGVRLKSPSC